MNNNDRVIRHYDLLIDENNDPVHDPAPLQNYMNNWDGEPFFRALHLSAEQSVLEIGIGTGRLALHTAPLCKTLYGIDLSPKTIARAKENLSAYLNVHFVCGDFLLFPFSQPFDVIYSSLTFMHIQEKLKAFEKISDILAPNGRVVLSIDKNQNHEIDTGSRKIRIYPDTPTNIKKYAEASGLCITERDETEFAYILSMMRQA